MSDEFKVHRLNETGLANCDTVALAFDILLATLQTLVPPGRDYALVVTKLQEANFFAKRGVASLPGNQL